ncbi:NADH-quinone oxidoreductase subunit J [bacterium]|nr:NADH-quinone oxidoreductase subunit J [bacterium]MCB1221198.1 NADH-quinone oxidoreductase subunit J [bacterium]UNM08058.1 MAG: NADH-quinone oxidoreductase subunit J [Planctomycetales bacterium]
MDGQLLAWWVLAIVGSLSAVMMVLSRNPVHSVLYLVANFLTLVGIYFLLSAPMMAVVQFVVYAGAIMILFLFVVMFFMSPEARRWLRPEIKSQWVFGTLLTVMMLTVVYISLFTSGRVNQGELEMGRPTIAMAGAAENPREELGHPAGLGVRMFSYHALPFEIAGLLLLAALLGAVLVARDERSEGRQHLAHEFEKAEEAVAEEVQA